MIIDKGRVIADGSPGELKGRAGHDLVEVHARHVDDLGRLAAALERVGDAAPRVDAVAGRVTVPVVDGRAAIARAVRALDGVDVEVDDIGVRRPTLDEVFLTLTGKPIDDGSSSSSSSSSAEVGPFEDDDADPTRNHPSRLAAVPA